MQRVVVTMLMLQVFALLGCDTEAQNRATLSQGSTTQTTARTVHIDPETGQIAHPGVEDMNELRVLEPLATESGRPNLKLQLQEKKLDHAEFDSILIDPGGNLISPLVERRGTDGKLVVEHRHVPDGTR